MEVIPRGTNLPVLFELNDIRNKIRYLQEWEAYLLNIENQKSARKNLSLQVMSPEMVKLQDTELPSTIYINEIYKLHSFLDENCVISPNNYVRAKDLYKSFIEKSGCKVSENHDFPKLMDKVMDDWKAQGKQIVRKRSREGIRYIGLSLTELPLTIGKKINDLSYNERRKIKRDQYREIQINMFVEKGWTVEQYNKIVKLGCLRIVQNEDRTEIDVDLSIRQTENAIAERIYKRYNKLGNTTKSSQYVIEAFHTAEMRDKISMLSEFLGEEYSLNKALQIISEMPAELKPFEEVAPIYDQRLKVIPEAKIMSRKLTKDINNARVQINNMSDLIKSEDILNKCRQVVPDHSTVRNQLEILRRAEFINNEFGRAAKQWELKD